MKEKLFTRNFIYLILGEATSLIGNFTLKFALSMYILEKTGSASIFANLLALAMIPTIILLPFGGILADRANRKHIMVSLDICSGISVLIASFLLSTENDIAIIGILLIVLSILGAFETPTVQACIPQILCGDNILKGNTIINQISAITLFTTPFLGSILYTMFGIYPILYVTIACFFITAMFECFIQLEYQKGKETTSLIQIVKDDFIISMKFICQEQRYLLHMLLLVAIISLFVAGTTIVGFPYFIRTVLGLSAKHYGIAESALGIAVILGSMSVGLLSKKISTNNLYLFFIALGIFLMPSGIVLLLPTHTFIKYIVLIVAFCGCQMTCSMFSIFAISIIQERTPQNLTGKIMAYAVSISMCTQPIGEIIYGMFFDRFANNVSLVLIPSSIIICMIGVVSIKVFKAMDIQSNK